MSKPSVIFVMQKVYDRKRLKKAGIKITDDLPFFVSIATRLLMYR